MARKILLADDSVTAQNMGRKILTDAGYDVITVNNGSAALKRVAESAPDLIILDVYMPGYSGLEVCQRIKETAETADIPVLLSVGKLEPFKPQEARRVRADAHIVKPFEASQLLTAIARLEDQMVPQQHKSHSRFATSGAGGDEPFARSDEGRILGRNAKLSPLRRREAAQGAEFSNGSDRGSPAPSASFRDFRKSKAKATGAEPAQSSEIQAPDRASASVPETSSRETPPPEFPRDITPEELKALGEVAAKLDESAPAAQSVAHEAAEAAPEAQAADITVSSASAPAVENSVAAIEEGQSRAAEAPVVVTPVETAVAGESEIPVLQVEPEAVAALSALALRPESSAVDVPSVEAAPVEASSLESGGAGSGAAESFVAEAEPTPDLHFDPVSAASFAQGAAAIDQTDEPMFAAAQPEPDEASQPTEAEVVAANADIPVAQASSPGVSEAEVSSLEAMSEDAHPAAAGETSSLDSSFAPAAMGESASLESAADEFCAVEGKVSESAPSAMSSGSQAANLEAVEPEAPMPSEAELAEALRLLTPATVLDQEAISSAETSSDASAQAAPAWSVEDTMELNLAKHLGKRWMAEACELTPEESSISLEAEMFHAFASNIDKADPPPPAHSASAIQTAVESRLAEMTDAGQEAGETSPKAMAAAAPAGHSSDAHDSAEIADIVDKVMADLRPKIVEEIARKLSGK